MAQPQNNIDEFLDDLILEDIFTNVSDTISLSHYTDISADPIDEWLSSLLVENSNPTDDETTVGNTAVELTHIFTETPTDVLAIIDNEQPVQNNDIVDIAVPQQANGSQNGIMYQMHPFLFEFLNGHMSVTQQPKANNRRRYQSDGRRFLPASRYHPMSIQLPDLQSIVLANDQTLGIVMTIVTSTLNPMNQTFVHANNIIYDEIDAEKIGCGCIFVPLRQSDINALEKKFPRLSILYKKFEDYTFNLTPFHSHTLFGTTETYTIQNGTNMDKVPKGKMFKKEFNLSSYQIMFHLAVKQNNVVYMSDITCETDVINEDVAPSKSNKRSASISTENLSEDESSSDVQVSSASKIFKPSTPPLLGLPVTRVSNGDIGFNIDHQQ